MIVSNKEILYHLMVIEDKIDELLEMKKAKKTVKKTVKKVKKNE